MIDILAKHGPSAVTLLFFVLFIGIAIWAFRPANKQKLQDYAKIPLKESQDGE